MGHYFLDIQYIEQKILREREVGLLGEESAQAEACMSLKRI